MLNRCRRRKGGIITQKVSYSENEVLLSWAIAKFIHFNRRVQICRKGTYETLGYHDAWSA